jgi:hypothetical protein
MGKWALGGASQASVPCVDIDGMWVKMMMARRMAHLTLPPSTETLRRPSTRRSTATGIIAHMTPPDSPLAPPIDAEWIERRIYVVRGVKVMLAADLAILYGVPTKRLNEQVRRNLARFPEDFLFQLTPEEIHRLQPLRSQFATLDIPSGRGRYAKYLPYAFTEHGVTMLSAVLRSERAVAVSVAVVRAFVRLRYVVAAHTELAHRVDDLEQRSAYHEGQLAVLFDTVHTLLAPDPDAGERPEIGFHPPRLPPSPS